MMFCSQKRTQLLCLSTPFWLVQLTGCGCDRPEPNPYEHKGSYSQLALAGDQTCTLTKSGEISCWKYGAIAEAPAPKGPFLSLSFDGSTVCSIRPDHSISCFGRCSGAACSAPTGSFQSLSVGEGRGCAIDMVGSLQCWGWSSMVRIPTAKFRQVQVGGSVACGVTVDKRVECFGLLSFGRPEPDGGTRWISLNPPGIVQGHTEQIAVGRNHVCALLDTTTIACWGDNDMGQSTAPPQNFQSLAAGDDRTCAITTLGTIECWGIALSWMGKTFSPPAGGFVEVALGSRHACARRANGSLTCWGVDQQSQVSGKAWQLIRN